MKIFGFLVSLAVVANAGAQDKTKTASSPQDFVPAGYAVFEEIEGDLNQDGQADRVLIIKGMDPSQVVNDARRGALDRNRRGILIAFKDGDQYRLMLGNRRCFSSENEDGGIYFAPQLVVEIERGILRFHYAHGRYGYWAYQFRYQRSEFEMIGYDSSDNFGPVISRETSANLITGRVLIRKNVNPDAEGGDEVFQERRSRFTLAKPVRLREVEDFDSLDMGNLLKLN